jgi:hypothetical protein
MKAIDNLLQEEFAKIDPWASRDGLMAHAEIEHANVAQKSAIFYRHFIPLRQRIVVLLGETYRKYFRLALAHPSRTRNDPNAWVQRQLQSDIRSVLEWIRQWYILACEGENDGVRHVGTVEFVPASTVSVSIPTTVPPLPRPTSWRAPAWLFKISPMVGVGPLKEKHVPANDSEERLGEAHTRLLLNGAKRAFFWELGAGIERVRNEETAAAGAIRVEASNGQKRGPNKRKGWQQRLKLYDCMRKVLRANPELQGMEFCAELDRRHAQPLLDWIQSKEWREGLTWKEAWDKPLLKPKIRRVRQEAQKAS